jgi:hypothetical protein
MRYLLTALALMCALSACAADNIIVPAGSGKAYVEDTSSNLFPLTAAMTTDGSSHVVPIMGASGGTVTANQGTAGVSAWPISAAALPLPSGASTSAKQPALGTAGSPASDVITVQGATSMTALKVDGSGATQPVSAVGMSLVQLARNDYVSSPVTTAAYVQLVAATSDAVNGLFIFDSSGQTLVLAVGAAASEVDKLYIVPGGNGFVPLASATVGELSISFLK